MENPTYLGDSVYAHFNGYAIALRLNDHRNEDLIILERETMEALIRFYNQTKQQ